MDKEVKRYKGWDMEEDNKGFYVEYDDHTKALSAERERAEKAEKKIPLNPDEIISLLTAKNKITALEAKVKELEKELETRKISIDEIVSRKVLVEELEEQLAAAQKDIEHLNKSCITWAERCDKFESALAAANAKIVELEVENNRLKTEISDVSTVMDHNLSRYNEKLATANKKISEQSYEIGVGIADSMAKSNYIENLNQVAKNFEYIAETVSKKAEKLVEAFIESLKFLRSAKEIIEEETGWTEFPQQIEDFISKSEQVLKEGRGEV